jgi:hypothetical protein
MSPITDSCKQVLQDKEAVLAALHRWTGPSAALELRCKDIFQVGLRIGLPPAFHLFGCFLHIDTCFSRCPVNVSCIAAAKSSSTFVVLRASIRVELGFLASWELAKDVPTKV